MVFSNTVLRSVQTIQEFFFRFSSRIMTPTSNIQNMKPVTFMLFPSKYLPFILLIQLLFFSCRQKEKTGEQLLKDDWHIASSAEVGGDAASISHNIDEPEKWIKASVPSTVLGALVESGLYKDIFFGRNLEKIPADRFKSSWWFRKNFELEGFDKEDENLSLFLDGINYKANVWLNGIQIASADTLLGAFRQFELNISSAVKSGDNVLLIEVFPPSVRNFYMGFVDWAPTPPDHNMGIFREVRIRRSGRVSVHAPFVAPDLHEGKASLTVSTEVRNHSDDTRNVLISGTIEDITFSKSVELKPRETKEVKFTPEEFPQLRLQKPRLWWPNGLGKPEMYTLKTEISENGKISDHQQTRFGIRKIETYLNDKGVRGYKVNGRPVLIKSAGWVDDLLLRYQPEKDAAQIRYVKEMNLNSLRFEGVWGNNHHIYDLCDENGILLMVGWSCQWEWPDYIGEPLNMKPGDENLPINEGVDLYAVKLSPEEENLMSDYFRDQVKWLRNHPSVFTWAGGSDAMPKPSLEQRYLETLKRYDPTRPFLVSSGEFTSTLTGPSGMKMNGPYEYVPPVYWYEDQKLGGAFGFNSETGPGPQIPPAESIRKMMPQADLWPPDNPMWNFHSGRKDFNTMKVYLNALTQKYGAPENLEDLALKAQLMNYEAIRPMFEAFVINRPKATGVVQWMLNSPWPEFYWQLYDYYLMPTGAYYGTRKAAQPLNIVYNYENHRVYLSNDQAEGTGILTVELLLLDEQSRSVFNRSEKIKLGSDEVSAWIQLPALAGKHKVYFLDLKIRDAKGGIVASNFYWLPTEKDSMDWSQYFWFYTPQKKYADFSGLNKLAMTTIKAIKSVKRENDMIATTVTLENTSDKLAFFIELELVDPEKNTPVLPVFWNDNYVSLLPGEKKVLTAQSFDKDTGKKEPEVRIKGYNLKEVLRL